MALTRSPAALLLLLILTAVGCTDEVDSRQTPTGDTAGTGPDGAHVDSGGDGAPSPDADVVSPNDGAGPTGDDLGPLTPPPECEAAGLRVRRVTPWVGGGVQLVLDTPAATPALESIDGVSLPSFAASISEPHGITGIIVVPGANEDVTEPRRTAAQALVLALPPGERIALWLGTSELPLLADVTTSRSHLASRIASVEPADAGAILPERLEEAVLGLAALHEGGGPIVRTLVFVGGGEAAAVPGAIDRLWLGEPREAEEPDPALAYRWSETETPTAAASRLAADISARRGALTRIGACPLPGTALVRLRSEVGTCDIPMPVPQGSLAAVPCDGQAAADDAFPYGEVAVTFTAEERTHWQSLVAAKDKSEFTARVAIGPEAPVAAKLHLHGQTSLECPRKSYTLDLDGPEPRRLFPGGHGDKLYLLSLCMDDGYYRLSFSDRAMGDLGVFPLGFHYVRLRMDGQDLGLYLAVEQVTSALRTKQLAVSTVIRRRYDPDDKPEEVNHPNDPVEQADALARYHMLAELAQTGAPSGLGAALDERMDLDGYLSWLAYNALFQNGDYADEAYFYASPELDGTWYFRLLGWDAEDLMAGCHHGGVNALPDPNGLMFCVEAKIDDMLVRSPEVYARYVAALELVIAHFTPEVVLGHLEEAKTEMFTVIDNDDTAHAMTELKQPLGFEQVRAEISASMDAFRGQVEARRQSMAKKVATWRASHP
ncbi:MAG: CotH kinase family protein [Myxococcales bacterium]|nr:CotH kinase family protein [Myxococcales bacterium]